jgi:phosphatidylinositol-3,4,5-trisphosphate 3-phosphatase/dual-specificity protein phosphatase PTEN
MLRPLTNANWASIRGEVQQSSPEFPAENIVHSEANSIADNTHTLKTEGGVVIDANRELRIKLYMGQVRHFVLF